MRLSLAISWVYLLGCLSYAASPPAYQCPYTEKTVRIFQSKYYDYSTGTWDNSASTWNWANALTALCDYLDVANSNPSNYTEVLSTTFLKVQQQNLKDNKTAMSIINSTKPTPALPGGFIDTFYDDDGWWALGWIKAFDVTGSSQYLKAAEQTFDDMTRAWDDTCGGGIWWTIARRYKNAIANELFFSVAAALANRVKDKQEYYTNWAVKTLSWIQNSGLQNSRGTFNDGLDQNCSNNGQTVWSYNQGVIIGGLVELNKVHSNSSYLPYANSIAKAAITELSRDGILHEVCEPGCGGGSNFKGIFVRNLLSLYIATNETFYKRFILNNTETMWSNDRTPEGAFGDTWTGPANDTNTDVMAETAAVDLLVAAYAVSGC